MLIELVLRSLWSLFEGEREEKAERPDCFVDRSLCCIGGVLDVVEVLSRGDEVVLVVDRRVGTKDVEENFMNTMTEDGELDGPLCAAVASKVEWRQPVHSVDW